ncbi:unnamed protein product [Jaminaea pallidilutea]
MAVGGPSIQSQLAITLRLIVQKRSTQPWRASSVRSGQPTGTCNAKHTRLQSSSTASSLAASVPSSYSQFHRFEGGSGTSSQMVSQQLIPSQTGRGSRCKATMTSQQSAAAQS